MSMFENLTSRAAGEDVPGVPVYRPTLEEFANFPAFIKRIEEDGGDEYGVVKVIPPKNWRYKGPRGVEAYKSIEKKVIKPVKQFASTISLGSYRVDLVETKKQTVEAFRNCAATKHVNRPSLGVDLPKQLPYMSGTLFDNGKGSAPERKQPSAPRVDEDSSAQDDDEDASDEDDLFGSDFSDSGGDSSGAERIALPNPVNVAPASTSFQPIPYVGDGKVRFQGTWALNRNDHGNGIVSQFSYELKNWESSSLESKDPCCATGSFFIKATGESIFDKFYLYRIPVLQGKATAEPLQSEEQHILGHGKNQYGTYFLLGHYNSVKKSISLVREYCPTGADGEKVKAIIVKVAVALQQQDEDALEKLFWRSIGSTSKDVPMYGGDQLGSIFKDSAADGWNVANLDTILTVGLDRNVAGITSPMLYVGMWRAMFAWHTEDLELNSINYLHFGEPKVWYSIHRPSATRFESACRSKFSEESNRCGQFMRHKNVFTSPSFMRDRKISYSRAVQYAGEFMLTFPRGYHCGFNTGFNCAESTNFGSPKWISYGRQASFCKCEDYTLRIDIDSFVEMVRSNDPSRLPALPVIGDRVCCRWKGDPKIYLCRVVKGKKGSKMHVVPAIKGEGVYDEPFDPAADDWSWPTPIMMSALQNRIAAVSSGSGGCSGKTSTPSAAAACSSSKETTGGNSGMSQQQQQIEFLKMQIQLLEKKRKLALDEEERAKKRKKKKKKKRKEDSD